MGCNADTDDLDIVLPDFAGSSDDSIAVQCRGESDQPCDGLRHGSEDACGGNRVGCGGKMVFKKHVETLESLLKNRRLLTEDRMEKLTTHAVSSQHGNVR